MRRSTLKTLAAAAWFFGLGWYVRATGLDQDLGHMALDGYKAVVRHTARLAAEAADERRQLEVPA